MISLKKINLYLFLIALPFSTCINGAINICLTGRIVKNLPSYGQSFLNAAYLAREYSGLNDKVAIKTFYYDDKPLSPIFAYQRMIRAHCSAIIGFEYLTDLLLISKIQTSKSIPIFTSYASTLGSNSLPKNFFVFRPSYYFFAEKMKDFLLKKIGAFNHVLLITEVSRDSMKEYKKAYESIFKKYRIPYDSFDFLENDKKMLKKLNQFLNKKHYRLIFLLSGAISCN